VGTYYYTVTATDAYGCIGTSDTATIIVDICNGIDPHTGSFNTTIFPVPSNEFYKYYFRKRK